MIGKLISDPMNPPTPSTNTSARHPSSAPMTASSLASPRPSASRFST
jgi:hypothetical protein